MTAGACADNLANQSYSKAFHVAYQLGQPVPAFYRSVIQISFHLVYKGKNILKSKSTQSATISLRKKKLNIYIQKILHRVNSLMRTTTTEKKILM